jgi:hypothetical protein
VGVVGLVLRTSALVSFPLGMYVLTHLHISVCLCVCPHAILCVQVKARMLLYSQHKFASNVVEKCLQYGSKQERNEIIEEVVRSVIDK